MEKLKKLILPLMILLGGYYMYLTQVSQVFHMEGTFGVIDDYSSVVLVFDESELSTYYINPSVDVTAIRADYRVSYRKYTKDIIGNFWSDEGIEPFALRGSAVAGRLYAECVGYALWPAGGDMVYIDKEDIEEMEESGESTFSFYSRFATKNDILRMYDYADYDFETLVNIPDVEAELMRLLDSLCPRNS